MNILNKGPCSPLMAFEPERDVYGATPALVWGLGFSRLIRSSDQTKSPYTTRTVYSLYWDPILTRILSEQSENWSFT